MVFVHILVDMKTSKFPFEISRPLVTSEIVGLRNFEMRLQKGLNKKTSKEVMGRDQYAWQNSRTW